MGFSHLILEVHCLYGVDMDENDADVIPAYCKYGAEKPGYHCMENGCRCVAYTSAPYEIAFAGENGEVDHDAWIGFGGDMEPENASEKEILSSKKRWEGVCKNSIEKSYEDYMEKISRRSSE